jgi:hypothetical protein
MLYYPQLATGSAVQFPLEKQIVRRTILNRTLDGSLIKLDDPQFGGIAWTLRYTGLTDGEREMLETFFRQAEGRLQPFTFLDPTGNLFTWSEDLNKAEWQKDGAVQILTGATDPTGSDRAVRLVNTAQIAQDIRQTIEIAGWFHYCFSFSVRSDTHTPLQVSISNAGGAVEAVQLARSEWSVVSCSGAIETDVEELSCRIELEPGAAIELFGLQLQAQPNPSAYRRTYGRSGVHTKARFLDDQIRFEAHGIDDHAATVRVFSRNEAQL